jgi:hypothetical protein
MLENELYIGNVYHSNCKRHLKDLGVKSMVNFSTKENENALNIQIDPKITVEIDFQEILS